MIIMEYLKSYRRQLGLSSEQMAVVLQISYGYYRQVENDFRQPSFALLLKIKQEFNEIDMNKIFDEAC